MSRNAGRQGPSVEPIAIVGIGCRFPGAPDARSFWRMLADGTDAVTDIPADRFDAAAFYDPHPGTPGKMSYQQGGFVADIEGFDPGFFGISPREATPMDPQQRLLLEVAWEAVEDAGEADGRLAGSPVGVFVGESNSDFGDSLVAGGGTAIDSLYHLTGSLRSMSSGRVSYALDLRGPSVTVDAACSSSLLAVHLACQSIWSGESTTALAGGVNVVLSPIDAIGFSQARLAARDGRCKSFAAGADGYVRGEGAGMVVLKPLAAAVADGNPVYAVIRGSGSSSDGRGSGQLMTPSQAGQEAALRAAYRVAGIDPALVQYVEAHGTGTVAGDPVEVAALAAVLGPGRGGGQRCLIGSVKTNIGHGESVAGVAGLIKATLSLHFREIPASLHSAELNPAIAWDALPLSVPQRLTPWPAGERSIAGVSSFGISGTNVHIVLEGAPEAPAALSSAEAPAPAPAPASAPASASASASAEGQPWSLLPLSARTPQALRDLADAYQALLAADGADERTFRDVCYTASQHRPQHAERLCLVARSRSEAAGQLGQYLAGEVSAGWAAGSSPAGARREVVFVFSGHGSEWLGMGRGLWAGEPVFRAAVERCADAMRPFAGWSLTDEFRPVPSGGRPPVDRIQPVLFAIQIGLAELWRAWGIEPDAVIGHSMGEVAAAWVAGALSLPDAARIICLRSALQRRVSGQGGMALAALPLPEATSALSGYGGLLSVAASNGPAATVISGDPVALADLTATLTARDVFVRALEVDVAFHSPQMDGLLDELRDGLTGLAPAAGRVPVYSTVTGARIDPAALDAGYWVRNLREPVLFAPAVARALADGHTVFVEVSPHPVLAGAIAATGVGEQRDVDVVPSLRRGEDERTVLRRALARLHCAGQPVNWDAHRAPGSRCVPLLPSYPWQRARYWPEAASVWRASSHAGGVLAPRHRADGRLAHPLLGRYQRSAARPEWHAWETVLGPQVMSYLKDHRVLGGPAFPAAAYAEMALAAAEEVFGTRDAAVEDIRFSSLLTLPGGSLAAGSRPGGSRPTLRLELAAEGDDDTATFQVFSYPGGAAGEAPVLRAAGLLRRADPSRGNPADDPVTAAEPRDGWEETPREAYYAQLRRSGLAYGPSFRAIEQIWRSGGAAVARVRLPQRLTGDARHYLIHPALLDACLQVAWGAFGLAGPGAFVPVAAGRVELLAEPPAELRVSVRLTPDCGPGDLPRGDVTVTDEAGRLVLRIDDLSGRRVDGTDPAEGGDVGEWLHALDWVRSGLAEPEPLATPAAADADERWLILSDAGGAGAALAAALNAAGAECVQLRHGAEGLPVTDGTGLADQADPADPAAWAAALREVAAGGPLRGIVHLWSLDIPGPRTLAGPELKAAQALGSTSVLQLVQALAAAGIRPGRLVLVTGGTQPAGHQPTETAVAQAPLWGIGRVLAQEQPELGCRLVDLSAASGATVSPDEIGALVRELCADDAESQVALRGPARYVARFVSANQPVKEQDQQDQGQQPSPDAPPGGETGFRADATYLITGGLGGLGLTVAAWMANHGARHLVLAGRREPDREAARAIAAIEAGGAEVVTARADITDEAQTRAVLDLIAAGMPPLRGVMHAAAVLDDGLAAQLTEERLLAVLAPKAAGAWHLHRLTLGAPLDFFVMFSSAAGLLGSPGQANYAAGNTFLDALAQLRAAQGLPALSIDWGSWAEVGMAAKAGHRGNRLAARGMPGMPPGQALEALGRLLARPGAGPAGAQVAVIPFDFRRWCEFYPQARTTPLFEQLRGASDGALPEPRDTAVFQAVRAAADPERRQLITDYLSQSVARILGLGAGQLNPQQSLNTLGLDSLMALELRNAAETDLGVAIPIAALLQGAGLAKLAESLDEQLTAADQPPVPAESSEFSDAEVDDLLALLMPAAETEA